VKAFLLGFTLMYALGVGVVLAMDEAVRVNNPWVYSFVLSGLVVPAASGWAGVEIALLVLRRRLLEPGRTRPIWRAACGAAAGLLGVMAAVVLAAMERPNWPDYVRTAATAFPAAALAASIGKRRRLWACGKCGYDLRGLTSAAHGRCPECGTIAAAA